MSRKDIYNRYLNSTAWKNLRELALIRDEYKCRICNSTSNLHVHHRDYPLALGTEPVGYLTTLCRHCHNLYHDVNYYDKPKKKSTNNKPKKKKSKQKVAESVKRKKLTRQQRVKNRADNAQNLIDAGVKFVVKDNGVLLIIKTKKGAMHFWPGNERYRSSCGNIKGFGFDALIKHLEV